MRVRLRPRGLKPEGLINNPQGGRLAMGLKGANTGSPQKQSFCGVKIPFKKSPPSPLMKGRGIKGEGLINNLPFYLQGVSN